MQFKILESIHNYFTKGELALWQTSVAFIIASFFLFDRSGFLTLAASLIGVTSLIFNAKGNPFGDVLSDYSLMELYPALTSDKETESWYDL